MIVNCYAYDCKYCENNKCAAEEICIEDGPFPNCDTYEPEEEGKDE